MQRLGRGLESLIGSSDIQVAQLPATTNLPTAETAQGTGSRAVRSLPVDLIESNPFQPRQGFDDAHLAWLAQSIKTDGILQPITVRAAGPKFQIIAGERRWRAARLAGLEEIPAIVRHADDNEMLVLALVENIHREDLNAIEKAKAYEALRMALHASIEQLGERLGQDRSTVSNYLRLLELDDPIQSLIRSRHLSMGHARALLGAPPEHRVRLAKMIVDRDLSVREAERQVQLVGRSRGRGAAAVGRPHVRQLEERMTQTLGTKTRIVEGSRGKGGRIVIYYRTLEDFDRICDRLNVDTEGL